MSGEGCPLCGGKGYVVEEKEGSVLARPCACRAPDLTTTCTRTWAIC